MKDGFKKKVEEIKVGDLPKEQWGEAIKAMRLALFPTEPLKIEPTNLGEVTAEDIKAAEGIMADKENIIIRYLRRAPTVGVKTVTKIVSDEAGPGEEVQVKQKTICSGVPYGCLVAFKLNGKMYVGWSVRNSGLELDKDALTSLFRQTFDMIYMPENQALIGRPRAEAKADALMAKFSKKMMDFLAGNNIKSIEPVAFGKKIGKIYAIIRALRDQVQFTGTMTKAYPLGRTVVSLASGVVPKDIARDLQWFIPAAEEAFGMNVSSDPDAEGSLSATVSAVPMLVDQPEQE